MAALGTHLTQAPRLKDNMGMSSMGNTKGEPFDIPGNLAREMLGYKKRRGIRTHEQR